LLGENQAYVYTFRRIRNLSSGLNELQNELFHWYALLTKSDGMVTSLGDSLMT